MPSHSGSPSSRGVPSAEQVAQNRNLAAQACTSHGLNDLFKSICAEALASDLEDPADALEYAAKRIREEAKKASKSH